MNVVEGSSVCVGLSFFKLYAPSEFDSVLPKHNRFNHR